MLHASIPSLSNLLSSFLYLSSRFFARVVCSIAHCTCALYTFLHPFAPHCCTRAVARPPSHALCCPPISAHGVVPSAATLFFSFFFHFGISLSHVPFDDSFKLFVCACVPSKKQSYAPFFYRSHHHYLLTPLLLRCSLFFFTLPKQKQLPHTERNFFSTNHSGLFIWETLTLGNFFAWVPPKYKIPIYLRNLFLVVAWFSIMTVS